MRVLVLTGYGLNCEEETAAAYWLAGADACIVHASDLFRGVVTLDPFSIVHLSGGFSFGDDLGSGQVLANRMRFEPLPSGGTLLSELARFRDRGGLVYGVCNGFQVLVKSGLLPNLAGRLEQEVTLAHNDSGRFEDRWVRCLVSSRRSPAFAGLLALELPVRHGEGKLVTRDPSVSEALLRDGLVCLTYADPGEGQPTQTYPDNPNGSELACAGLVDTTGRVLGTMPHPEAYLSPELHPAWPTRARRGALPEHGEGLRIFQNLVLAASASPSPAQDRKDPG